MSKYQPEYVKIWESYQSANVSVESLKGMDDNQFLSTLKSLKASDYPKFSSLIDSAVQDPELKARLNKLV